MASCYVSNPLAEKPPGCLGLYLWLLQRRARGMDSRSELVAHSTGGQISSRLLSMRSANALLELPQASG